MVDIMVRRVVRAQMLQRVPGQSVSTMVIHGFEGQACEKPHALPCAHTSNFIRNGSP
jgi:hypothetical protein